MSGKNIPDLNLPPGVVRNGTPYSVGKRWHNCNWVRWIDGNMMPIGGWTVERAFGTYTEPVIPLPPALPPPPDPENNLIRDTFSWRDYLVNPWYALGSDRKLMAATADPDVSPIYDITPADLSWTSEIHKGYGAGLYGNGKYGQGTQSYKLSTGQWSMDNFGRQLLAVHSHDGRLLMWDPLTAEIKAVPVAGAPPNSQLVVVTDERMVMLLGGDDNPRRIVWSSRENMNDWTPTALNTAGGFDLQSSGSIVAACKVQGGLLVLTDVDAHIIEYIGPPNYYGRRRISDEVGCLGKNSLVSVTGSAMWISHEGFWSYDGNITPVTSTVDAEVFKRGYLKEPANVFMGYNAYAKEVWLFYPRADGRLADRYVFLSLASTAHWSMGRLERTAWLNPIWQAKPFMYNKNQEYEHEVGLKAGADSRVGQVWAETGQMDMDNGERSVRIDRLWQDESARADQGNPSAYEIFFKLRQAPSAPEREVGPITLNNEKGYTTLRMRARNITLRVSQTKDEAWQIGKMRLRVRSAGAR